MKKYITIALALILLAGSLIIMNRLKNLKKPAQVHRVASPPFAYVSTVNNTNLSVIIPATGSLVAKNKIKLYSEVQGVLDYSSKEFKPGVQFSKGDLVYKLNSDEFNSSLLAQKSSFLNLVLGILPDIRLDFPDAFQTWETYVTQFDINKPVSDLPIPKTDMEKNFVAAKNIYTNFYSLKNLEIKLKKYSFYAPFNGILTEAVITPGTLVSPGQNMGEFVNPAVYEMEVTVNSSLISKIRQGDNVKVENLEAAVSYTGKVSRINQKVDLTSQTVNLFIELQGADLREGMYLRAFLESKMISNAVEIHRNLLINQNQVFTVSDSLLNLTDIKVVYHNDKTVVIQGLTNGQQLLTKPVPKAYHGMKVAVQTDKQQE